MKYFKKRDLILPIILLLVILILTILVVDYSKKYFSNSAEIDFDGEADFKILNSNIVSGNYSYKNDKLINYTWINDSILEIKSLIILNCGCEEIEKANYMLYLENNSINELAVYYATSVDNDEFCEDCISSNEVRFRIGDLERKDYNIILVRFYTSL